MPQRVFVYLCGLLEGLLAARLIVRLFAGRPDNPVFDALLRVTEPLRVILAFLDAGQPRLGSSLEYSTLVMLIVLPVLAYVIWRRGGRGSEVQAGYR